MGKRKLFLLLLLIPVLAGLLLFLRQDSLPGWEVADEIPAAYRRRIQSEIQEAAKLLQDSAETDAEEQEQLLISAGYSAMDTDPVYPAYLANSETLAAFWQTASSEKDAFVSLLKVLDGETFRHIAFLHRDGETVFLYADVCWTGEDGLAVVSCDVQPVYEMELADWGIFYYRLYPAGDPHYIDYGQIRLESPDREAYDLCRKYVLPVGYQMVNLFLCDWQEGAWGEVSFSDLLESLYQRNTGAIFDWTEYPFADKASHYWIPAEVFEDNILPYFAVSLEDFRRLCRYDEGQDAYLYRPIRGDDLTTWRYPMCEPEVAAWTENPDGTLTMTVQVYSPELKTDRLFVHELTVRPLEGEDFQYVSNQVTYVSDRGLPPNMPRFALDEG